MKSRCILAVLAVGFCMTTKLWSALPASQDSSTPAPSEVAPTPPAASETTATPVPAESAPAKEAEVDPKLAALLEKVEKRGNELKSFQARMLYTQQQPMVETMRTRNGTLYYLVKDSSVKFRIHFSDLQEQDLAEEKKAPVVKFDEDYVFDGLWFTIRNARLKSIQRQEISKTPAKKEEFRLGKGPFPLPFAITKDDVLKQFEAKLAEPGEKDPKETDHLVLIPKKDSSFAEEYVQLELWIARENSVPMQLRFEKDNMEVTTIEWSQAELDKGVEEKQFSLPKPEADWTVEETPLEEVTADEANEKTN